MLCLRKVRLLHEPTVKHRAYYVNTISIMMIVLTFGKTFSFNLLMTLHIIIALALLNLQVGERREVASY